MHDHTKALSRSVKHPSNCAQRFGDRGKLAVEVRHSRPGGIQEPYSSEVTLRRTYRRHPDLHSKRQRQHSTRYFEDVATRMASLTEVVPTHPRSKYRASPASDRWKANL